MGSINFRIKTDSAVSYSKYLVHFHHWWLNYVEPFPRQRLAFIGIFILTLICFVLDINQIRDKSSKLYSITVPTTHSPSWHMVQREFSPILCCYHVTTAVCNQLPHVLNKSDLGTFSMPTHCIRKDKSQTDRWLRRAPYMLAATCNTGDTNMLFAVVFVC